MKRVNCKCARIAAHLFLSFETPSKNAARKQQACDSSDTQIANMQQIPNDTIGIASEL